MDCKQQRRKRKRIYRPYGKFFSARSLTVCLSFFVFVLFISSDRSPIRAGSFQPALKVSSSLSLFPSLLTRDSFETRSLPLVVEGRVLLPDHLLLILSNPIRPTDDIDCVYYRLPNVSSLEPVVLKAAISVDEFHGFKSIARCELPPMNYSAAVDLRRAGDVAEEGDGLLLRVNQTVPMWDRVVYEAMLDWNTAVVFVKGFNLIPHRVADPTQFRCHFGLNKFDRNAEFMLTTEATSAAQEVIRCLLPRSIRNNTVKAEGIRVTVSRVDSSEEIIDGPLPSVAKIYSINSDKNRVIKNREKKYELCACTMLWNQASFLNEWITYHAWLGVERWFIYDNNSDDEIQEAIHELNLQNYNISRHVWPWIKAQESGFSHCVLRARRECKWVGFFDVDEFFYFPRHPGQAVGGHNSLQALIANYTDSPVYAEIRTTCHSYGPSGLTSVPLQGVTVGYTCRLGALERHKSIVRPELLDITLLNAVHHFKLREGFKYVNVAETTAVVNHYKYQVWETFKAKFFRRVSTYVTNWQEDQNKGSKDRAPGLGTEAIEPPNWRLRFCEVWDTGLKDFVLANFADAATGFLPWEKSSIL